MTPSEQIDKLITDHPDWRGKMLARLRQIILETDPEIKEEWKWGTAMWNHNGLIIGGGIFKDHMGLNFFKGASLPDPHKLFNGGLDAKTSRSIKLFEGDTINEENLKQLILEAVKFNTK